jgi:hypothetical protein
MDYETSGFGGMIGNAQVQSNNFVQTTTGFIFPDWIRAGWYWMTSVGRMFIDLVFSPYTIFASIGLDSTLASFIGIFMSMVGMLIMVNWLTGRDT